MKNVRSANILLLLAAAGVSLAACEVALRIFYPGLLIQDNVWPPHLSMRFNPAPGIMPGVSGESVFTTNSYGIRGDELSGQYARRILAVGGSATECLYLSQAKSWPYLLQRKLDGISGKNNVWVGNAGMSGANTNHHIKLLRYFPLARLKIDTLIILAGINDFSRRLALDQDYVPFYVKEESDLPVVMRTALGRLLVKTGQVFSKQEKEITQDNAGKVYVAWRSNRRSAKDKIDVLPDMSSALGEYRQNVNTIIDIAKRNKIRVIFLTQPALWKADLSPDLQGLLWLGGIGDFQVKPGCAYYSVKALSEGMGIYNDALLSVCRSRNVECVDLASLLPKDTGTFYDDCHFNEKGAEAVSEILARYLQNHR